jgi:hypothetical protein
MWQNPYKRQQGRPAHVAPDSSHMDILANATDYGDGPSFVATGVCRAYFLSRNMIRIVFCRRHQRDDGSMELRVSGSVDWDIEEFQAAHAALGRHIEQILAEAGARLNDRDSGTMTAH